MKLTKISDIYYFSVINENNIVRNGGDDKKTSRII